MTEPGLLITESARSDVSNGQPLRFYRPELDVLRFLAFSIVYLDHAITVYAESPDWLKAFKCNPGVGVPLFFALSAYLVTELLSIERRATGTVSVRLFYTRRILRIWPLYFLVLCGGFLLSHLYSGTAVPVFGLLSYVLLVGNWYTTRYGFLPFGMGPLWSISVEEQFYLLWPSVVRAMTRRSLAVVCVIAWIGSQAALLYLCHRHVSNAAPVWTNSLVQLQYFAIGVGVSLYLNGSVPKIPGLARFAMVVFALLLFPAADCFFNVEAIRGLDQQSSIAHTYPVYLLIGVCVLAMLIAFLGWGSMESFRAFRYLGKISYGLYVYHPLALLVGGALVRSLPERSQALVLAGFVADVGIAWISYEYFEKPFMRMKERFAIVKSRGA